MYGSVKGSYGNADVRIELNGNTEFHEGCSVEIKGSTVQISKGRNYIVTHLRNCLIVAKPIR